MHIHTSIGSDGEDVCGSIERAHCHPPTVIGNRDILNLKKVKYNVMISFIEHVDDVHVHVGIYNVMHKPSQG